ncbi:hypothetical protein BH11BAC3_BH11BAC3_28680 [soil metagenome]
MKKQFFIAAAFIAAMGVTGLHAQQAAVKTADTDLKKEVKCRITSTSTGCDIVFENEIKSPKDPASGQATGRRQHRPVKFSVGFDNVATEITNPKDIASGQASGKRTEGGISKGFYQWIQPSWDKKMAIKKIPFEESDEIILPVDSPDGEYELVLSWSWGQSNQARGKRSYTGGRFILEIQGGELHAINSKGTSGTNK